MDNEYEEAEFEIKVKAKMSAISSVDSGVARIHESYVKDIDEDDIKTVMLRKDDRKVAVKLVSDSRAPKNVVTLRKGDMDKLGIEDGEEIVITPYTSLSDDIKGKWKQFKEKLKKDEEEEEGDE